MAKMGSFSVAGLKQLQQQLNKLQQGDVQAFVDSCAKELAARLLAAVIKRTLPGQYPKSSGKKAVRFVVAGLQKRMRKPLLVLEKVRRRQERNMQNPLKYTILAITLWLRL